MKALTVWQPWASLIAARAKPYEFRGWKVPKSIVGQRIAIHAGARVAQHYELQWLLRTLKDPRPSEQICLHGEIAAPLLEHWSGDLSRLPLSSIVCTAVIGAEKPGDVCARDFGHEAGNDSEREGTFNYGWPLTDIQPLNPVIPARGRQGFWNWEGR